MNATVCVVMPVYNAKQYLGEAVQSIIRQSCLDFELFAVDDGSTDNSLEILQDFASQDSRIQIIRQDHKGIAAALNFGIAQSSSPFIARMDADDISYPERLATQLAFLEKHADIAVVGSSVEIIDQSGQVTKSRSFPSEPSVIAQDLFRKIPICHPTVVMRRDVLEAVGGYDERFSFAEDHNLWLRIADRYRLANIDEPLLGYRDHPEQVTSVKSRKHSYIFSILAPLEYLISKYNKTTVQFNRGQEPDFHQICNHIKRLYEAKLSNAERHCLYYQTARLFRYYRDRPGMRELSKLSTQHAIADVNLKFFGRRLFYRFFG